MGTHIEDSHLPLHSRSVFLRIGMVPVRKTFSPGNKNGWAIANGEAKRIMQFWGGKGETYHRARHWSAWRPFPLREMTGRRQTGRNVS